MSDDDACLAGMRAIRATTSSICAGADLDDLAIGRRRADRRGAAPGAAACARPLRPARRWRCRAACSRAGAAPRAWPRPPAPRRCTARGDAPRTAIAVPARILTVSGIDGSSMVIFCSRRASARSFSMCLNSSCVVEPTTRSWPAVRIGLISVARSIVPPVVAPAPTVEWISSMNRIGIGRFASALMTALKRSSKSPRKRVPASSAPVSSEKTSAPSSSSGTSSPSSRVASPSASAVLPTPASPTNTGLFFRRRQRISIVRCSSSRRPISGSSSPARARAVRFSAYADSGSRDVAGPRSRRARLPPRPGVVVGAGARRRTAPC